MRHEKLDQAALNAVDIAAVLPAGSRGAQLFEAEARPVPAAAAPDVPLAAGMMIVAAYTVLLISLGLATVAPGPSLFALLICGFFAFMFFSVPAAFFKVEAGGGERTSMARFLAQGLQTNTGHCNGGAALVQMLVVPVTLTFGVLCMGLAAALMN